MCTPQLRAQAATLEAAAHPNPATTSGGGGAPSIIDPLRRQIMAVSPIIETQRLAPRAPERVVGAGVSPFTAGGVTRNLDTEPTNRLTNYKRRVGTASMGGGSAMSIADMLAGNSTSASAKPGPVAVGVKKPDAYEEQHAPTPDILAEANRDAKVRTPFTPKQPDTPTPFSYSGSYLTTPEQRRWLMEPEARLGTAPPYPSGSPGPSSYPAGDRARERIFAGYLYTLPEVKAFLDVLSHTEGTERDGYFTTHGNKPAASSLARFGDDGRQGRYQFLTGVNDEIIKAQMARQDFGEVTQDMAAIALLIRFGAMQKLIRGDLRGAFSAASQAYASLPMSQSMDHSGFTQRGKWEGNDKGVPRQRSIAFAQLPALYLARLNSRRTEFREAERNWRSKGQMPWAFISPYRQQYFGRDAFKPSR